MPTFFFLTAICLLVAAESTPGLTPENQWDVGMKYAHQTIHFLVGEGDEKEASFGDRLISSSEEIKPVEVTDVEVGAFKAMLAFIYADDLSGLNGDNAISVLYAADKYHLPKLVKACLNFPIPELRNVFVAFDWARFLGKDDFARRCLDYIDENADALILSEEFLQIDQQLLCEILDRDELWISEEIAIWNAALRWADEKCRQNRKEPSAANRRAMLGSAPFIKFEIKTQNVCTIFNMSKFDFDQIVLL